MKFYVAGKFQDRENVRKLMTELEGLGHIIPCDWTDHTNNSGKAKSEYAVYDMEGVRESDIFVGRFIDDYKYNGAIAELGMALIADKQVFIVGRGANSCIFTNHPSVQKFENELEFLSYR